jgi:hypothetical protein
VILLTGCAGLQAPDTPAPRISLEPITDFVVDRPCRKCLYATIDRTVYLIDESAGQILIYRDGKKINTIGGIGFGSGEFQRLTDIALAPDGKLLALDSFARIIKKFDNEGKYLSEVSVDFVQEPTLLAVSDLETYYLYDRNRRELVSFTASSDPFYFGKFMVTNPTGLGCTRERLWVHDSDRTLEFTADGQFEKESPDIRAYNALNAAVCLRANWVEQPDYPGPLSPSVSPLRSLYLTTDALVVCSSDHVFLWKVRHATP